MDTTRLWKQDTLLTPASQYDLGGAAGLHSFPVRNLGQLLRILYMVHGNKAVIEGISKTPIEFPTKSEFDPPWIQTLQRVLRECRKPSYAVCFTDGSWTAATSLGHRFAQEPSPQKNVTTAGNFYCARPGLGAAPHDSDTHQRRQLNQSTIGLLIGTTRTMS